MLLLKNQITKNQAISLSKYQISKNQINARHLHTWLNIQTKFADWFSRVQVQYNLKENENFFSKLRKTRGRPMIEYYLTVDTCKLICMLQKNEIGEKVRKYFIEVEKNQKTVAIPDYPTALRELADSLEDKKILEAKLETEKKTTLNLANGIKHLRNAKAKEIPSIDNHLKNEIGRSINQRVRDLFEGEYKEKHLGAREKYRKETGNFYPGAKKASLQEKINYLNFLNNL